MAQKDFRKDKQESTASDVFAGLNKTKQEKAKKEELRYKDVTVGDVELTIKKWTATERFEQLPAFMDMWYSSSAAMATQQGVDLEYYNEGLTPTATLSAAELTMAYIGKFQDVDFASWVKSFCGNVFLKNDLEKKPIDIDDTFNLDTNPTAPIELIEEVAQANFMMELSQAILLMPNKLQIKNS